MQHCLDMHNSSLPLPPLGQWILSSSNQLNLTSCILERCAHECKNWLFLSDTDDYVVLSIAF